MDAFINSLSERLKAPLPGKAAQYKMASRRRLEELGDVHNIPPDARVACVLNLLHFDGETWRTVLIQRTDNPRDRHSGQISFPGGRIESGDQTLEAAALRETEEEVGVPREHVQILGRLTELYIPVSNFVVHPFIGVLREQVNFVPQAGEVASILTPELNRFNDISSKIELDIPVGQGLTLKQVPCFRIEGRVIWGATAMIMNEFLEIVDAFRC